MNKILRAFVALVGASFAMVAHAKFKEPGWLHQPDFMGHTAYEVSMLNLLSTDGTIIQGGTKTLTYDLTDIVPNPVNGIILPPFPSPVWEIYKGATLVASNTTPNGWSIAISVADPLQVNATCPLAATLGNDYVVTYGCTSAQVSAFGALSFPLQSAVYVSFPINVVAANNIGAIAEEPQWMVGHMPSDKSNQSGEGASSAYSVNLATGIRYETPNADITVRNPFGPSATFQRFYSSSLAARNLSSPGMGLGWSDNFWYRIEIVSSSQVKLHSPSGSVEVFNFSAGTFTPVKAGTPNVLQATGTPGAWTEFQLYGAGAGRYVFTTPVSSSFSYLSRIENMIGINPSSSGGRLYVWRDSANGYRLTGLSADSAGSTPLLTMNYSSGKISTVVDSISSTARGVKLGYDGSGNLTSVSRVQNPSLTTEYRWQYTYSSVANAYGGSWTLLTNTRAATGASSQPDGTSAQNSVSYGGANGKVTFFRDAKNNRHVYTYNTSSTDVTVKDPSNLVILSKKALFNASNLVAGYTDAHSISTSVAYSDPTNPNSTVTLTDRDGRVSSIQHDSFGNVTYARGTNGVITRYVYQTDATYAPTGRIKSQQVFDKNDINRKPKTVYVYFGENGETSSLGLLKEIYAPIPGDTTLNVDTAYQLTRKYQYTALGNISKLQSLDPSLTSASWVDTNYTYTDVSNPVEILGQPIKITGPTFVNYQTVPANVNVTHSYGYNDTGRVAWKKTKTSGPQTSYTYSNDRLTQIDYPAIGSINSKTVYTYRSGKPVMIQEVRNSGSGDIVDRSRVVDRDTEQEYTNGGESDASGNLLNTPQGSDTDALFRPSQESGSGAIASFDDVGVLSQFYNVDGNGPQLDTSSGPATDNEGNVLKFTNARGQHFVISRNADTSIASVTCSATSYPIANYYTYDDFGRLSTETSTAGSLTYTYDTSENVLSVDHNYSSSGGPSTYLVSYAYNPAGYRISMTMPFNYSTYTSSRSFLYYYNAAGLLTNVRVPWTSVGINATVNTEAAKYGYDSDGSLKKVTARFGDSTYTYTNRGWLAKVQNQPTNTNLNGPNTLTQSYVQDAWWLADGRMTKYQSTNIDSVGTGTGNVDHVAVLSYNNDYSIKGVTYYKSDGTTAHPLLTPPIDDTKDSKGNPTKAINGTTLSNTHNKITNSGYSYDSDGNVTARNYPGMGSSVTRVFDPLSQLCNITNTNAGTSSTLLTGYLANGKRAFKDSGTGGDGAKRWFIYDDNLLIAEIYQSATPRYDVWASYAYGTSGLIEFWRKTQNRPTQMFYDLFSNPSNRMQFQPGSTTTAQKTKSIYAPNGRLWGDYSVSSGLGYSWANDPVGPQFQLGFFSDEETRQYTNGSSAATLLGQAIAGKKIWDTVEGRYVSREDRFANTYVDTGDGTFYGENYEYILTMFDIVAEIPIVGAPVQICQGIDEWNSGNRLGAGFHFAAAALSAVDGAVVLNEARAVSSALVTKTASVRISNVGGKESGAFEVVREVRRGESVAELTDFLKNASMAEYREYGLARLNDGRRVIFRGGAEGVDIPEGIVKRLIGHVHPWPKDSPLPSPGDLEALKYFNQRSSYIYGKGSWRKFTGRG